MKRWEQDDSYQLEAELPGIDLADLDITVTGPNQLTIKGQRKATPPADATPHRQERVFGEFVRTVSVPSMLDADKVDARFENGVLKLTLPKHEAAKPRKITIRS
jgi:HSP20 family protein